MRLFVALDIPQFVRDALTKLTRQLRQSCPTARWVSIEGAHVTLKFIGETPPERLEEIRSALGRVPATGPIDLRFAGLGFFPDARRPRAFWAGVEAGAELRALAASVETHLEPLGLPRETRSFHPHITLARFKSPEGLEPLRTAVGKLGVPEFGRHRAGEFHLYQSVLKPQGAEYTRLASYQISGGARVLNPELAPTIAALWWLPLLAYFLGSIPFGYLIVLVSGGGDVRRHGSGNIGATNVARVSGTFSGLLTLALDAAKGYLAVYLAAVATDGNIRWMMVAALLALLGHLFPVWLRFRGGKGVATGCGVFLPICWQAVAASAVVFLIVLAFWRYVSLASIGAAAALPLLMFLLYAPGHAPPPIVSAVTSAAMLLVIWRHRANITRLLEGSEPRFTLSGARKADRT